MAHAIGRIVRFRFVNQMEDYLAHMSTETLITLGVEAIALLGAGLAAYTGMKNEMTKMKSRIYVLEQSETKIQSTLETLVEGIQEIKILLAKKGIE